MIYVEYLRSTDRAALDPVIAHNRSDLLALVLLHGEVARVLRAPQTPASRSTGRAPASC